MGWVLVALLLLPAGVLTADGNFGMLQPGHLSAIVGGSIEIPFSFFHPWELAQDPEVKVFWRWKSFHREFIYNMTPPFIHKHFKDRLVLNFTKNGNSGSLSILNLRKEDETMYFCRVHLKTKKKAIKTTTQMKTTTERSTSVASEVTSAGFTVSESQPLSLGAIVGVAVATAMLITGVLVLVAFLRWRRKGQTTTAQAPGGEVSQNTEEKYENIAYERQQTEPQQSPKNDSTVYAVLTLSNSSSPRMPAGPPLHGNTQEEMTLYSVLKTK
ncbi:paired immunoglobulin-like type 2 receptor alpha isoform X2 [Dipodomys spectabilis]|uniref:paired immunoglobulin-like type 2 receptor alpha isoform X2 n=1 Tax=Dipodomys spectabilis TaxID=105255 RepID=UPI001C53C864|nr:paired immunoglobulin-like type 2 receptor alpha isoform X2 [Dipodomys spectabilis]